MLALPETVADFLETQRLLGVLHLLNDNREIVGIGESQFLRGAAWTGPLDLPSPAALGAAGGQP